MTIDTGDAVKLALKVGAANKDAACAADGTDSKELVCSYTVATNDEDINDVSGDAGSLALSGNAEIVDRQVIDAAPTHSGRLAQSGHNVETTRPGMAFPSG